MKSFLKNASIFLALQFAFCLIAAEAQTSQATNVLIDNNEHYASYRVNGQNVILTLELIDDFTDEINGDFPNSDFVSVKVDVNHDSEISSGIDTAYGMKGKPTWIKKDWTKEPFVTGLCTQFLLTSNSSTPCGKFSSKSSLDFGFRSTDKQAQPHPVYIFTIPINELSNEGQTADVRIVIYSAGKGYKFYPAMERGEKYYSFSKVLKIEF